MTRLTTLRIAAAFALVFCATAQAQLFRAYLSSTGSDANPCTLAAPCRLLPAALAAVADKGEIWMLDSANYNTVTVNINKNVSILAVPGAVGSIVATGGPAIAIGLNGSNVALRNVVIVPLYQSGSTTATYGISMTADATLSVEHSLIANLPSHAVLSIGGATVRIVNSILRNNGDYGLLMQSGGRGEVASTQMLGNGGGVMAYGPTASTTAVTVSDSVISGGGGVNAQTSIPGAMATITVSRSTISQAAYGLRSASMGGGTAVVSVNGCTVTGNTSPWIQSGTGSVIRTMGNNQITDNVNPGTGSLTPTALQ
jgi:hypothetical protein